MKQTTAFLLAVCLLLQPLGRLWVYVSFRVNREAIAQTLCVQKDVPDNCCQGKCYLEKQLKKADEQHQKQLSRLLKGFDPVLYYAPNKAELFFTFSALPEKSFACYQRAYSPPQMGELLKPPEEA